MGMDMNRVENASLLALLAGVSVLLYFVFAPFFLVLVFATVFAILLQAPYEKVVRMFGGWKNSAALATVGLTLILLIGPLFLLGVQVFQEAQNLYVQMLGNEAQYMKVVQTGTESLLHTVLPGFTFDVHAYVANALMVISANLGTLVYQTIYVFFEIFFMLLALFFFLRDGRAMMASFVQVSPFGKGMTENILNKMRLTIRSVFRGTIYVVIIRWVCMWIAFSLFGIPNALLWSAGGAILGVIPGIGTAFAFIGGVAYLYLQGAVLPAIGLALLGTATTILIDNILTSYFFSEGLEVSQIFVLFSILGGIMFFGPVGFILGPLVLSVFLAIIRA